jgi:hypothetical protein
MIAYTDIRSAVHERECSIQQTVPLDGRAALHFHREAFNLVQHLCKALVAAHQLLLVGGACSSNNLSFQDVVVSEVVFVPLFPVIEFLVQLLV